MAESGMSAAQFNMAMAKAGKVCAHCGGQHGPFKILSGINTPYRGGDNIITLRMWCDQCRAHGGSSWLNGGGVSP